MLQFEFIKIMKDLLLLSRKWSQSHVAKFFLNISVLVSKLFYGCQLLDRVFKNK